MNNQDIRERKLRSNKQKGGRRTTRRVQEIIIREERGRGMRKGHTRSMKITAAEEKVAEEEGRGKEGTGKAETKLAR